ncbi:MAG TPA: beta-propeller fold lactonase family protein, partial [Polyangiales bacterium]
TTALPSKLDKRSDSGGGFVHASISPNGKVLLAADYNGGRLVGFPIGTDGKLGEATSTVAFGSGANTHSSGFHPSGQWAYAPNKGLNKIAQFEVDAGSGVLTRRADLSTEGRGPRMFTITPNGKYAYVMFEDDGSVEGYRVGDSGLLERIDREATLPNEGWGAHALVHPGGKYLYVSARDSSALVSFTIADDGDLTQLEHVGSEGKAPRCFDIDDSGKWLVVANQGDNDQAAVGSLAVFAIGDDGKLSKRGSIIGNLKAPTAVAIVNRPKR